MEPSMMATISKKVQDNQMISTVLQDIEQNNEILRGLLMQLSENRLEQISERSEILYKEYLNKKNFILSNYRQLYPTFFQEYSTKIKDSLQPNFGILLDRNDNHFIRQLADIIFYFLYKLNSEPVRSLWVIVRCIDFKPLYKFTENWYEFCCETFHNDWIFTQFYNRSENNPESLEQLVRKHPGLLFNKKTSDIMKRLVSYLPFQKLHRLLTEIRDTRERTCMFNKFAIDMTITPVFVKPYADHVIELLQLLSVQDVNKQTALHINSTVVVKLLHIVYAPIFKKPVFSLLSMRDNNNNTAEDLSIWPAKQALSLLRNDVQHNWYPNFLHPALVLIISNTKGRPGAMKEALTIFEALKDTGLFYSQLEQDKTGDEIIELIKHIADGLTSSCLRFSTDIPASLTVILLSHGRNGAILDSEQEPISLTRIEETMCSIKSMTGRPKILITQCCQVESQSSYSPDYVPTNPHFCAVMSCVSGQPSQRGVFVTKLASKVSSSERNLLRLVEKVSREMEMEGYEQTPIMMSTLQAQFNYPLYLKPAAERKKASQQQQPKKIKHAPTCPTQCSIL